uniref:Uncharacterized protein n=1 Tax=Helianthus annuus TaxID=4232 RepID=A0A251RYW3_HELAN
MDQTGQVRKESSNGRKLCWILTPYDGGSNYNHVERNGRPCKKNMYIYFIQFCFPDSFRYVLNPV